MALRVQPPAAAARGALQLLDSLDAVDGQGPPGAPPLPPHFLEELVAHLEAEDRLDAVAESVCAPHTVLGGHVRACLHQKQADSQYS